MAEIGKLLPAGIYGFCWLGEIESKTAQGWRVVEFREIDRVEVMTFSETSPGTQETNWCMNTKSRQEAALGKNIGCVLWKDEQSALSQLTTELEQVRALALEGTTKVREAERKEQAALKDLSTMTISRDAFADDKKKLAVALTRQEERSRKLETDLGKIRAAIGTKQFDEIVASESK